MNPFPLPTWRSLAAAGASALLVATVGLVSSSAAEPAAPAASAPDAHGAMVRPWAQHLQAHLDRLAERLEIKASQQTAWQKFAAAFKETVGDHGMMGVPAMGMDAAADADAATLARRHAERAEQHARHLSQLADATAALQASLSADQRQVFNEVARHFAAEHGMGPTGGTGHGYGIDGHHEGHCSGHGMGHGYYGHDDDDEGMHGPGMAGPHGDDGPAHAAPH